MHAQIGKIGTIRRTLDGEACPFFLQRLHG